MFLLLNKKKNQQMHVPYIFKAESVLYILPNKNFFCFQELKHFVSEIIEEIWKHQWYPQYNSTTPQAFRNHESDVSLQKKNHTIDFKPRT